MAESTSQAARGGPRPARAREPAIAVAPALLVCALLVVGAPGALGLALWASPPPRKIDRTALSLGDPIGSGTYGAVRWAQLGSIAAVAKWAHPEDKLAKEYLAVEEDLNNALAGASAGSLHLAPYLGGADVDGVHYLVWEACGARTLQDYLVSPSGDGRAQLATALGVRPGDVRELMRTVLREILECCAAAHACGIVHRDVKPENLLVDETTGSLRLIDFGSACQPGGLFSKRTGYSADRAPCSVLYAPPEQFLDERVPFAYDSYSAAIVWLRCVMPALQGPTEDALRDFRAALARAGGDVERWLASSVLAGDDEVRPEDAARWARGLELYDGAIEGRLAWRLLRALLERRPERRLTPTEALAGPYLGPSCSVGDSSAGPVDPDGACYIDDFMLPPPSTLPPESDSGGGGRGVALVGPGSVEGGELIELELRMPLGLVLEEDDEHARELRASTLARERGNEGSKRRLRSVAAAATLPGDRGVVVAGLVDGGAAKESGAVLVGDELLAVGPFDVAELGLDGVIELLSHWSAPTVLLSIRRHA